MVLSTLNHLEMMYVFKIIMIELSSLDTLLHYVNQNICPSVIILIVINITVKIQKINAHHLFINPGKYQEYP